MSDILHVENPVVELHTREGVRRPVTAVNWALAITAPGINPSGNWPPHVRDATLQLLLRNGEPH